MLKQFKQSNDGNVAIMTGAFILLLLVLGGGAVDIIRVTTVRAELQSASDSAVLAAASLSSTQEPVAAANNFFDANFDGARYAIGEVEFTASLTRDTQLARVVNSVARAQVPTLFLKFIDVLNGGDRFGTIEVVVNSQAQESFQALEIAMVLDVSGSMNGQKINNLRNAGSGFVDQLFDNPNPDQLSISLVPFSANVNIAPILTDYVTPQEIADAGLFVQSPCILYEDIDFNNQAIIQNRELVLQPSELVLLPGFNPADGLERNFCGNVPVLLNSNNQTNLVSAVQGLTAGGRTDAHIGLLWGVKALSPALRGQLGGNFASRPLDHNDDSIKALVMMSDGDLNPGRDVDGVQRTGDAESQFMAMCNVARNDGILVFTIGFQIAAGSRADELLRDCASNPSQYFFVEGLDLDSAFEAIAAAISNLRVSE